MPKKMTRISHRSMGARGQGFLSSHTTSFGSTTIARFILTVAAFVFCMGWIERRRPALPDTTTAVSSSNSSSNGGPHDNENNDGALRRGGLAGVDFLWQGPAHHNNQPPTAILFLAHGCHHAMTDWWLPSSSSSSVCPDCLGLPEERAIVQEALQRNMLVVATSSTETCWSAVDGAVVAQILQKLQQQHDPHSSLPILAFGASSGGHFVSDILPTALAAVQGRLDGYISQIMATSTTSPPPPHVQAAAYIVMRRDEPTTTLAQKQQAYWNNVHHRPCLLTQLEPLRVTDDFFARRIPEISRELSQQLVHQALLSSSSSSSSNHDNLLDADTRLLLTDPRHSDWQRLVRPILAASATATTTSTSTYQDSLVPDQSPLSEVLNVAYGMHEMSRDGVAPALDFLLQHTVGNNNNKNNNNNND